ncbi:MAG: exodeoxyribonuclease VII large subunit, partial [Candidatus Aenigmatarchaeota archaeon]
MEDVQVLTPSVITEIIRKKIEGFVTDWGDGAYCVVDGILGEMKKGNSSYSWYYGVPLRDTSGSGIIEVNIPDKIAEPAYVGRLVRIYGFLKVKVWSGRVSFSIDVTDCEPLHKPDKNLIQRERSLSEFLSTCKKDRMEFPELEFYNIAVVTGANSLVLRDFQEQLKDPSLNGSIIPYHANMLDVESIISALEKIEDADIVVMMRGGGDSSEFDVFNDIRLLQAWQNIDCYKISALGHTEHRTMLDIFSDMSCDTPTDAGVFIRNSIKKVQFMINSAETIQGLDREIRETKRILKKLKKTIVVMAAIIVALILYINYSIL